jgi:hypothetical protein
MARRKNEIVTNSTLMQQTISAVLAGKKGSGALKRSIEDLNVEAVLRKKKETAPKEG